MKKTILFLLAITLIKFGQAQVVVNNTNTVASYVQNVLLGPGVTVSNITYNGAPANVVNAQVGEFTDITSSVGLSNGMIVGSGDVNMAAQPNTGGGSSLGGSGGSGSDPDLIAIVSPNPIFDQAILEFDFVSTGDTLSFNYIFASEEYEEYVCSNVNDVFGFFLTGNNPLGGIYNSQNIALIPDPLVPGTFTTTPVTINTVNPGVAGANGTAATCAALDPNWATYNVFYQSNTGGTSYEYDGRTTLLPIVALVNCGETYHIKIAIADVGDAVWDSGVFLEAGSFGTNSTLSALNAVVPPNVTLCSAPYNVNFSAGPNPPPQNYWDFGDGAGTDTAANPFYTYADTGTYIVMYIASDSNACVSSDTAYFTVTINQNDSLAATFSFPPADPCADSMLVQLDFTGSGADSLFWDMGDGTTFINDTSVTYYYTTPGTYIITFEAYDTLCGQTFTLIDTAFFNPVFTTVNAVVPPNVLLCDTPYTVNFMGNNPSPPNSFWDFGDGVGTSTQNNPSYTYATSGLYNVMYVVIDSSTCNIADTVNFQVQITLAPLFSATIDFEPPLPCTDLDSFLVELAFTGTGADSLLWNLGDGTQLTSNSISYVYSNPGTYTITMTAFNFLCGDQSVSSEVTFTETRVTESIIPNVFTPNGDGMNDKLEFVGIDNTAEYSIQIFSRWGNKVYEGTDALAHWDGGVQNAGTYFYILKYTDACSGEEKLTKGTVSLLR